MMTFFRTLYAKLAAALSLLLLVVAIAYVGITLWATKQYFQDAHYRLHKYLARSFVSEGLIGEKGTIGESELKGIFHTLMLVNPSIEVYLTDNTGKLLSFSAPPGKVKLESIDLIPVRQFLSAGTTAPVWGDDPRHPDRQTLFSVAEVLSGGEVRGYLYVVLAGEPYQSSRELFLTNYVLRIVLVATAGSLFAVLLTGLLSFFLITRRLHRLGAMVDAFHEKGDPDEPEMRGDELERLEMSFERMRERITQQVNRIRASDTDRRRLIENISHDLRTPLSSLQGHLETLLLKEEDLDEKRRRHFLEIAVANSRRLSRLVDELFELAHLDAPELRLRPEHFNLPELVQDVAQKFSGALEGKRAEVDVQPPDFGEFVYADLALIERVLENLLKNAIEHTADGGVITITFRQTSDRMFETCISDTGPGIPEAELEKIFDRFYRSKSNAETGRRGHGLGLAIVRRIVELHGGATWASNAPGTGAAFCFTLPITGMPLPD